MKVNSHNEWDPLRAAIVGTVEGFAPGLEAAAGGDANWDEARRLARQAFPDWYLDEVAEDLEDLCTLLRQAGVHVLRPRWTETRTDFATPNWAADGFDIYNVRDQHIVFGDLIVCGASPSRFRLFERYALQQLLYDAFFDDGFRWVAAPLPALRGDFLREVRRAPTAIEVREDEAQRLMSGGLTEMHHVLEEREVIFDAANIIRLGRDVLFLVSSTGNRLAARWLTGFLGPSYRVHVTDAYRASHLDSTILPLRQGLVLLNGARVTDESCPRVFDDWDRMYFTDVAPLPESEVAFHQSVRLPAHAALQHLGVSSTLHHISSPWAGLNVLSLDPDTVLVHDRQTSLIRALEARGLTVAPVRMRHCYTMLGGLHCTTLDVIRAPG